MKLNLSKHLPDRDLANNGIWREIFPDIKFRIAFAGAANKSFKNATMRMALKANIRQPDVEKLTDEQLEALSVDNVPIYAEHIVKDWEGVEDEDTHETIPYNVSNAKSLLEEYPEVFQEVFKIAKNADLYKIPKKKDMDSIKKK